MIKRTLLSLICTVSLCTSAIAQDEPQRLDTQKYSPDYCEFTATFPEKPFITNSCENAEDKSTCFNLISYTKVFVLSASVQVEIICNPSTPAMYTEFTPEVMENTVRAMTKETVIEAYEVNTRQDENYRQTGLVGRGRKGLDETMYIAQLWIGQNSIMSVEAELSGEQIDEADELFAKILGSIGSIKQIDEEDSTSTQVKEPKPQEP